MSKSIILIYILFQSGVSFSQNKIDLEFIPLIAIDTIAKESEINELKIDVELNDDRFFIKDWIEKTNQLQKSLFFKQDKIWVVYPLVNEEDNFSSFELSDNNRFITYNTESHFGGRNHYEAKTTFNIIDIENLTFLSIISYLNTEDWEEGKSAIISKCSSAITLENNIVTIKNKHTKNLNYNIYFESDCLQTGKYKIENEKLIEVSSR
jgi:hypothetical protein